MSAGAMQGQVVISEVDAFGYHQDRLGRGEDWIELHNAGTSAVYLGGLFLSDDPDEWINLIQEFPNSAAPFQRWIPSSYATEVSTKGAYTFDPETYTWKPKQR